MQAQTPSLVGTRWDINIPSISEKPYNFIFSADKKGNVLLPEGKLADFTWSEDGKGTWSATVEQVIKGIKKTELFYGKINGNTGSGFYVNEADKKNAKSLTMIKK